REKYSHVVLLKEIGATESEDYRNYFRMSEGTFDKLLRMGERFLIRKDTNMRESLPVNERLAVTLRYLATGRNFEDLTCLAVMSPATISVAVVETCKVLIYILQEYMKFPTTPGEWVNTVSDFGHLHQFWNTVGAIDGKHIAIKKPAKSGSLYYNYKRFFIVLLAVVNATKEFIMVDAGMNGRISDGGVLYYSKFGELLEQRALNLPKPTPLLNTAENFPYVFVADEAFALDVNLIKPYSWKFLNEAEHEFNNRLSRARVVVENTFGILAFKFGVFQKPISLESQKAKTITMACCYLHNFLAKESNQVYFYPNEKSTDENDLANLQSTLNRNSTSDAKKIRDKYCEYYNNEGKSQYLPLAAAGNTSNI
ncbi:hypothetical protein B7P43_G06636, partial [Cryptotermes secundus]